MLITYMGTFGIDSCNSHCCVFCYYPVILYINRNLSLSILFILKDKIDKTCLNTMKLQPIRNYLRLFYVSLQAPIDNPFCSR
jgi:hypothetical protein